MDRLVRTIEAEIIPRLVLARGAAPEPAPVTPVEATALTPEVVTDLAGIVLKGDVPEASTFVDSVRDQGVSVEAVYLDLLAPTARHLGDLWTRDVCDFAQVTVGLCRLQQVLHDLSAAFQNEGERREHGRRVLLVPTPGEQHSFGLAMVAEFFRRAGWDVWSGPVASRSELVGIVRSQSFAVIGFSVASEAKLEALVSGVRAVRRASRNRHIGVMVGGPIFVAHPELVPLVGADATATDGRQAALRAEHLLALLPHG